MHAPVAFTAPAHTAVKVYSETWITGAPMAGATVQNKDAPHLVILGDLDERSSKEEQDLLPCAAKYPPPPLFVYLVILYVKNVTVSICPLCCT